MSKTKAAQPRWITNLRHLMESRGFNPRSLSLTAKLNPTAVRDMLEGRTKFPRYDTVQGLSAALNVTPAQLMGEAMENKGKARTKDVNDDDLDLLTEIIARLQEVAEEHRYRLVPRDFAAMVTTIYRQMQTEKPRKSSMTSLSPKIYDLLEYETRRRKRP